MGNINVKIETKIVEQINGIYENAFVSKLSDEVVYRFEQSDSGVFQYGLVISGVLWSIGNQNEVPIIFRGYSKDEPSKPIDSSVSHFTEDFVLKLAKTLK